MGFVEFIRSAWPFLICFAIALGIIPAIVQFANFLLRKLDEEGEDGPWENRIERRKKNLKEALDTFEEDQSVENKKKLATEVRRTQKFLRGDNKR